MTRIPYVWDNLDGRVTTKALRGDQAPSLDVDSDGDTQEPIDIDLVSQQIDRLLQRNSHDQTVGST